MRGVLFGGWCWLVSAGFSQAQTEALAPAPLPTATPSSILNQPVVVNSFENVEMERLRIAEELAKSQRADVVFREQMLLLQKKLLSSSLAVGAPESIPTDFRSFLSINEGDIERSKKYYMLLKATLNHLTPQSPYLARLAGEGANPNQASANLLTLDSYAEDDGISRTLRGHLAEFYGGQRDDAWRIRKIDGDLATIAATKKQLVFQMRMGAGTNPLTGRARSTDDDYKALQDRVDAATKEEEQLKAEKQTFNGLVTEAKRKLQFQQYIVELAFQQRYIHALIACGFYRGAPSKGDLSISKDAYPSNRSTTTPGAGGAAAPGAGGLPSAGAIPSMEIPFIATISGMESFLTNRIRDAIKDREAMDNMLKEKQMTAAEGLLRKMVLTAKYQPELNTIPYSDRQRILGHGKNMRELADALNAKDYPEISRLAGLVEQTGSDAGMKDLQKFAAEQPKSALYLVRQAEMALKAGDRKTAQSLTDSAMTRAPLDSGVTAQINKLQNLFLTNTKTADELKRLVDAGDYQTLYTRANEFAPLAAAGKDKTLQTRFEKLLEKEKSVRTALEKCDTFERRSSYPDVWLTLCGMPDDVASDARIANRKSGMAGKCPRFLAAYNKATEREKAGADSLALAWYLSALTEAPGNPELEEKIQHLGTRLLNN